MRGIDDVRGGSTIEQQYVEELQPAGQGEDRCRAPGRRRDQPRTQAARDPDRAGDGCDDPPKSGDPGPVSEPRVVRQRRHSASGTRQRTYFGVDAADLTWPQAALLAGVVRSTSSLNPYTNPDGALARRNLVLDTLIEYLPGPGGGTARREGRTAGRTPPGRSASAGLHRRGESRLLLRVRPAIPGARRTTMEDVARNGYLIRTTLDPKVQDSVKAGDREARRIPTPPGGERDERDHAGQGHPPSDRNG